MKPAPIYRKPWALCVGSDRVSTMLRAEYWERFRTVQAAVGYQYIRCHGLLDDELGVLRIDEWEGRKLVFHNFSYLDQVFDTMLENRVRPFVEWGFMPEALASGPDTVFWWKGNITPPSDWELWSELVASVTRHWIERYGAEEVRLWPFEVWNEPNLTQFWKDADRETYFRLYETTAQAVKAVDPAIRVGGPAISGGSDHWIETFLAFVRDRGLPLDFFSRHLYTGQTPSVRTPELLYQSLSDPESPLEELKDVRRRIDACGFAGLELHITEFNTSYHPLCPVHDTPLNAAYLARLLSESGDLVASLSYWTFSDLFEESDVPRAFFHGGFGLLARSGVPKPTFHLFDFFSRLGETVLERRSNALVTARGETVALTAWNPVREEGGTEPVSVTVSVPWTRGTALARRRRVHDEAGNAWGVWASLGRPRFPDRDTVEFLRLAAQPSVETTVLEPSGGTLTISFSLLRNEITLIEIAVLRDESSTYLGLDDARVGYSGQYLRQGGLS